MPRNLAIITVLAASACFDPYPLRRVAASGASGTTQDGTGLTSSVTADEGSTETASTTNSPDEGPAFNDEYVILQYSASLVVEAPGILDNDVGTDLAVLDAPMIVNTDRGYSIEVSVDGSFTYPVPEPFWGHDGFTYEVMGADGPDTAHVDILVRPTTIKLADVASGFGGFVVDGAEVQDQAGYAVAGGGDVNGDSFSDILIGSPDGSLSSSGQAYLIYGGETVPNINLAQPLNASRGISISGLSPTFASIGHSVALADIDGDGYSDIMVGDPDADGPNGAESGCVTVIFGKEDLASINLSSLGTNGYTIWGPASGAHAGWAVAPLPDIDGDGVLEIAVGAPSVDVDTGSVYIVHGESSPTEIDLFMNAPLATVSGTAPDDFFGRALASGGDIDGDERGDIVIGALGAPEFPADAGISYVVFGIDIDTTIASKFQGDSTMDHAGTAVGGGWDVNGDGFLDIVIGAPDADPSGDTSGQSYVVFGPFDPGTDLSLSRIFGSRDGFAINGESTSDISGTSVALARDINGDGLGEILIGAPRAAAKDSDIEAGRAYVIYGGSSTSSVSLTDVAKGTGGFAVAGIEDGERVGFSVADAGDVNGDGISDIVIGAHRANGAGNDSGRVYVVYGVFDRLDPETKS